MKILFISLGYRPVRMSGFDIGGELVVNALTQAGHQVTVIACEKPGIAVQDKSDGVVIRRIRLGTTNWIGYGYQAGLLAQQLQRAENFDIVHFWDVHFAWAYSGSFIATVHQSFQQRISSYRSPMHRLMYYRMAEYLAERPALRKATHLMAVSNSTRDEFIQHYGIPAEKISLARMGIDCARFKPDPAARTRVREKLGIERDQPLLFFSGFMTPRKGIEFLLEAMPKISPSPKLMLVGRWDAAYRKKLNQLIAVNQDQLIELGYVNDEEMPGLYAAADLYISPSQLEGFGLPLAESLACGTPVIAADAGSAAEVIGPGGLLVQPRDPDGLGAAISATLQDQDRIFEMSRLGKAYIMQNYTTSVMLGKIQAVYEHFLAKGGK